MATGADSALQIRIKPTVKNEVSQPYNDPGAQNVEID
jgi:hypothetical protein